MGLHRGRNASHHILIVFSLSFSPPRLSALSPLLLSVLYSTDQRLDLNKLSPNDSDTVRGQIVGEYTDKGAFGGTKTGRRKIITFNYDSNNKCFLIMFYCTACFPSFTAHWMFMKNVTLVTTHGQCNNGYP